MHARLINDNKIQLSSCSNWSSQSNIFQLTVFTLFLFDVFSVTMGMEKLYKS